MLAPLSCPEFRREVNLRRVRQSGTRHSLSVAMLPNGVTFAVELTRLLLDPYSLSLGQVLLGIHEKARGKDDS